MSRTTTDPEAEPRIPDDVEEERPSSHDEDAEALFREARRRRRRRRVAMFAVVLLTVALVAGSLLLVGHGPPGRAPTAARHAAAPQAEARPQRNDGGAPTPEYFATQSMGLADGQVGWAMSTTSLEVTTDAGQTWTSVTPANLNQDFISSHVTAVDAIGTNDLWLVLEDVPGLVPFGQSADGSDRGNGIDHSTDGGRSWTFGAVPPGCLQTCGPISLSFVDAAHGFAVVSPPSGGAATLFVTRDGGATWSAVGPLPNLGAVDEGGPTTSPQLVFTSLLDGWALTGPQEGSGATTTKPGGTLYRTTDGGRSWSRVRGLPTRLQYTLPVFFRGAQGITVATNGVEPNKWNGSANGSSVYVTDDGGATWTRHALPAFRGAGFSPGGLETRFAAVGPLRWRIDVGSKMFVTNNGGQAWTTLAQSPEFLVGAVSAVVFSSTQEGMAIGTPLRCSAPATRTTTPEGCYPALFVTSDGGRQWSTAKV